MNIRNVVEIQESRKTVETLQDTSHLLVLHAALKANANAAESVSSSNNVTTTAQDDLMQLLKLLAEGDAIGVVKWLKHMQEDGSITDPAVQEILNDPKVKQKLIALFMIYFRELSMEDKDGTKGMSFFDDPIVKALFSDAELSKMKMAAMDFIAATGSSDDRTYTLPDGTVLHWKTDAKRIKAFIEGNQGGDAAADMSYILGLYRDLYMQLILAQKNPAMAIILLMQMYDGKADVQETSFARQIDLYTDMTNGAAADIISLVNKTDLTPEEAIRLVKDLSLIKMSAEMLPAFSSVKDNLIDPVNAIRDLDNGKVGTMMDDLIKAIQNKDPHVQDIARALATEIKGLGTSQTMINNAQQIATVLNGRSKAIQAQVQALTQIDTAAINLGKSVSDANGSYQQFINSLVRAQKAG